MQESRQLEPSGLCQTCQCMGPGGRRDTGLTAGRGDGVACAHETVCICALDCARARAWLRVWCGGGRRLREEAALFWSAGTCALGHADQVADISEEPGNSLCICCPLVVAMSYESFLPQPQPRQNPGCHLLTPLHPIPCWSVSSTEMTMKPATHPTPHRGSLISVCHTGVAEPLGHRTTF